jgi:hypothetical protein
MPTIKFEIGGFFMEQSQHPEPIFEDKLYSPRQVVKNGFLPVTVGTLANWRGRGRGPNYTKIGRKICYPGKSLIEFRERHSVDLNN